MTLILASAVIGTGIAHAQEPASTGDFRLKAPDAFEELTDFIVQLGFALFALVGFFLKDGLARTGCLRCFQILLLATFALSVAGSFVLVYLAKTGALTSLASGYLKYEDVSSLIGNSAWLILVAGAIGLAFVGTTLGIRRPTTQLDAPREEERQADANVQAR